MLLVLKRVVRGEDPDPVVVVLEEVVLVINDGNCAPPPPPPPEDPGLERLAAAGTEEGAAAILLDTLPRSFPDLLSRFVVIPGMRRTVEVYPVGRVVVDEFSDEERSLLLFRLLWSGVSGVCIC